MRVTQQDKERYIINVTLDGDPIEEWEEADSDSNWLKVPAYDRDGVRIMNDGEPQSTNLYGKIDIHINGRLSNEAACPSPRSATTMHVKVTADVSQIKHELDELREAGEKYARHLQVEDNSMYAMIGASLYRLVEVDLVLNHPFVESPEHIPAIITEMRKHGKRTKP
jgi:hypothetical protein